MMALQREVVGDALESAPDSALVIQTVMADDEQSVGSVRVGVPGQNIDKGRHVVCRIASRIDDLRIRRVERSIGSDPIDILLIFSVHNKRADWPCAMRSATAFLSNETKVSPPSQLPS